MTIRSIKDFLSETFYSDNSDIKNAAEDIIDEVTKVENFLPGETHDAVNAIVDDYNHYLKMYNIVIDNDRKSVQNELLKNHEFFNLITKLKIVDMLDKAISPKGFKDKYLASRELTEDIFEEDDSQWYDDATDDIVSDIERGHHWLSAINDKAREYQECLGGSYDAFQFAADAFMKRIWSLGLVDVKNEIPIDEAIADSWFHNATEILQNMVEDEGIHYIDAINKLAREYQMMDGGHYNSFQFASDALCHRAWTLGYINTYNVKET